MVHDFSKKKNSNSLLFTHEVQMAIFHSLLLSFFFSHMSYPILYSGIHHNVFVSFDKSGNNAVHCLHAPKIFYTEQLLFFFPMVISYLFVTLHAPTIINLSIDDRAKHHNQWGASTSSSIICIVTLLITRYYNSIHLNITITPSSCLHYISWCNQDLWILQQFKNTYIFFHFSYI